MKYYPFPENKIWRGGCFLGLFALLLLTRDAMYSMMVLDFYTCQFLSLAIIGILGIAFLTVNRKHLPEILKDPRMALILFSLLAAMIPMVVKGDWQLMYFSIILGMLLAVFVSYFMTLREVARWYVLTMCALGAWSVLTAYVLRLPVDTGLVAMKPVTNSIGVEFYNFVFSIVPDTYVRYRNFGIFREPGVYQFFLIVALYLNNDVLEWRTEKQLWICNIVLGVTMLTTFATGGMIEMGLLFVILFFEKKWYRNKWILLGVAVAAVLAGAAVIWIVSEQNELYYTFLDMVGKFTRNPESVGSRLGSITLGVQTFFRSPLVGESVDSVLHAMVDNSTSTLILYNIFGILGGTLNVAGWFTLVWRKDRGILVNLLLVMVLFMAFNTQNLTWNLFFWIFPGMALAERGLPLICGILAKGSAARK